ncbi:MAG: hypothetical protein ACRDJN_27405, partial [Chloroflexota bacterium]
PAWFSGLNGEVRYQLTPIGAAMPGLHVAAAVASNRFRIGRGVPGGEVSWQLTARWLGVDAPVELDKPTHERGTYVNPELYGQPAEKSLRARQSAEALVRSTALE